jgi:hypothetical protein
VGSEDGESEVGGSQAFEVFGTAEELEDLVEGLGHELAGVEVEGPVFTAVELKRTWGVLRVHGDGTRALLKPYSCKEMLCVAIR